MSDKQPDMREIICSSAKRVFLQKGYIGAKMMDIAAEARISPATIYKYYSGKKSLFDVLNIPEARDLHPQYDQNRSEIINAALILFGEHGFEGTTMDLIAQHAGYSKATLYQYFENKKDLFSVVMKETPFHFNVKKLEENVEAGDLYSTIKTIGLAYFGMFNNPERIAFVRTIIRDSNRHPEIGDIYHKKGIGYVATYISDILEKYRDKLQAVDLQLAAKTYVGSLFAFVVQYKIVVGVERHYSDEEIVDASTKIFLNGVLKNEFKNVV